MGGQAYGVVGHEVIANGLTTTTDDQALFVMSGDTSVIKDPSLLDGGIVIEVGMTLPGGSYALMVGAVGADDPTRLEAPSNVLFFTAGPVAPPATAAPDPTSAPSPADAPTTTLNYQPVGDSTPNTYPTYPSTTMAPVQNGGWEIRLVSPNQATLPTTGGLVALYGTFPQTPYVWFGSFPATPLYATPEYILVPLPKVTTPGWVDISLGVGGETILTAPDAFQFVGLPVAEPTPTTTAPGL